MSGIYTHKLTSMDQVIDAAHATGATGVGLQKLVQDGATAFAKIQAIDHNDPFFKSTLADLTSTYKPSVGPMGSLLHPSAAAQQAGALADYNTEYQKLVQGGKSPEDAAFAAQQSVVKKWGAPVDQQKGGFSFKAPKSYEEQLQLIRENPLAAKAAGLHTSDIQDLFEAGLISQQQAVQSMQSYLRK